MTFSDSDIYVHERLQAYLEFDKVIHTHVVHTVVFMETFMLFILHRGINYVQITIKIICSITRQINYPVLRILDTYNPMEYNLRVVFHSHMDQLRISLQSKTHPYRLKTSFTHVNNISMENKIYLTIF